MKSELFLSYQKNRNNCISSLAILAFFSIFFLSVFAGNYQQFKFTWIPILILITYFLAIFYLSFWLILYKFALKYENKNEPFPKWLKFSAKCLFIIPIVFYDQKKHQRIKIIGGKLIFNIVSLLITTIIYISTSFSIFFKITKLITFINTGLFSFIVIFDLLTICLTLFLYYYQKKGNKILKWIAIILGLHKNYQKIIHLNGYQAEKPQPTKLTHIDSKIKKVSNLYLHYHQRRNWFILLILAFLFISFFALMNAITILDTKKVVVFSVIALLTLIMTIYLIFWFILYKFALKYENKNKPFRLSPKYCVNSFL